MSEILRERAITQVIVLDLSLGSAWISHMTQLCEGAAVRLLAINDLDAYFHHTTTTLRGRWRPFHRAARRAFGKPANRFVKRLLDLAVAVPAVFLILPFSTLLVWVLQRLQSPGPILFRQVRTGLMARPFSMFKYRTMRVDKAMRPGKPPKTTRASFRRVAGCGDSAWMNCPSSSMCCWEI